MNINNQNAPSRKVSTRRQYLVKFEDRKKENDWSFDHECMISVLTL